MPDDVSRQLGELSAQRADEVEEQVAWFSVSIQKLLDQWKEELDELLDDLPSEYGASRLAELSYLKTRIADQLRRLGYAELAQRFIGLYEDADRASIRQLQALGVSSGRLGPLDNDILETLRQIDFGRLFRVGESTSAALSENILLNAIGGLPRSQVIENLGRSLGEMQHLAVTYADTGLVSFDRTVHWQRLSSVVDNFQYTGPDDMKCRPFCKAHVGKVYSKAEILQMDNGNLNPVWRFGGGWNCRHVWNGYLGPINR